MLGRLYNYVRGTLRTETDRTGDRWQGRQQPRYGRTVTYTCCRSCGEGCVEYDTDNDVFVCRTCGAIEDD